MIRLGFHASHEQIPPDRLLADVQEAERAGFDAAMCSDHFAPWGRRQGHSGFSWPWLGAALATTRLPLGVVVSPGQRYHPAIVAQAIATIGVMFPGRFGAALGSGEAMNEHVTGQPWPSKAERDDRLEECAAIIAALLDGDEVSHRGTVDVHEARLWTRPEVVPPRYAAAVTAPTAGRVAAWADGLVTVAQAPGPAAEVVTAFRAAGGRGPCFGQVHIAWADSDAQALAIAHDQWRHGVIGPPAAWEIERPEDFDRAVEDVTPEQLRDVLLVASDADELADRIVQLARAGFDGLYLHHVGQDQAPFLELAAAELLAAVRSRLPGQVPS